MEFEQIMKLVESVSASNLSSFQYESEGVKLTLECGKSQPVVISNVDMTQQQVLTPAPVVSGTPEKEPEGNLVKSPLVGTFYVAPSEDAEPFIHVGDQVKKGQILAIVEAMKLMNDIESDFDGEITEIYVKNGEAVEYGQPLFSVK
ncbi:MAG TPA: acetyl-CoA carboxylase biotin carboxyl carrier protein [Candidatus Pelethocola excrementipullorum]|nr:acetyl-CoA carboxylase biotin carboxyl carrier protein [Candidatus Pelethocola excrementipullorum]